MRTTWQNTSAEPKQRYGARNALFLNLERRLRIRTFEHCQRKVVEITITRVALYRAIWREVKGSSIVVVVVVVVVFVRLSVAARCSLTAPVCCLTCQTVCGFLNIFWSDPDLQIKILENNIQKAESEIYRLDDVLEKIRLVSNWSYIL